MQLEVLLVEPLLTYVASNLLTDVEPHMRLQVGVVIETLFAHVANVRLFIRVHTQMDLEMGQKWEVRLWADVALEVLLSVDSLHCVR